MRKNLKVQYKVNQKNFHSPIQKYRKKHSHDFFYKFLKFKFLGNTSKKLKITLRDLFSIVTLVNYLL